ncbi:MAG: hypothetical protein HC882_06250 [Acidobacteria bacterium]|nr:hypothetical protein [Acidobacteriota bacterium]
MTTENKARSEWWSVGAVALAAISVIVLAEVAVARVVSIPRLKHVYDAIPELEASNPDVLVLGSSHARSLEFTGREIERRTGGRVDVVSIPVEGGRLDAYLWVIENFVRELVDERDASGEKVRSRISQFILVTDYWDTCPNESIDDLPPGIPGTGWSFRHFIEDVAKHGFTGRNRNYVRREWRRLFGVSEVAQDRHLAFDALKASLKGETLEHSPEWHEAWMREWQQILQAKGECAGDPARLPHYLELIDFALERGWETTVLVFPKLPETLTPTAMETTVASYQRLMESVRAARPQARYVDVMFAIPLERPDFTDDLDHLSESGNRIFTDWVLERDLAFLLDINQGARAAEVGPR